MPARSSNIVGVSALARATVLLTAGLIASCATPDRVVRLLDDSNLVSSPFENILVVGAHEDSNARRTFEEGVARAINDGETMAQTSLRFMRASAEIDRESVLEAVAESGADAVLVTRLVDMQARRETQPGRTTMVAERRDNIPLADFFRYEYSEYQDPMVVTTVTTVVLATDVYRVSDENLIWSVESRSIDKVSVYDTVDSVSRALTGALRSDGLIR
jgi:hypothetical protein